MTGNSTAVSNVASASAGGQTQPLVDQIAAAVANKVPNAAPLIASAILANNTVTKATIKVPLTKKRCFINPFVARGLLLWRCSRFYGLRHV